MHRFTRFVFAIVATGLFAGCRDSTSPRDIVPPAAPRGVHSVTGDHRVFLEWLANTESDVVGYRIYQAPCADGPVCPYDQVGVTSGAEFTVTGLSNGQTRYFAVSAYDRAGNESDLSYETVFDTPRPEGFDLVLSDATVDPEASGWDFSTYTVRAFDDSTVDIYYVRTSGVDRMVAPFSDTDIQDAGYALSLDAVDFAPMGGWSATGAVEVILGHCYVVRTHDHHYAKLRARDLGSGRVHLDWAYQVDPDNRELKARREPAKVGRVRRPVGRIG